MEFLAWLGSICLAVCAVPYALSTLRRGYDDTPLMFLLLWSAGELLLLIAYWGDWALVTNYGVNCVCLGVVWRYRWAKTCTGNIGGPKQ